MISYARSVCVCVYIKKIFVDIPREKYGPDSQRRCLWTYVELTLYYFHLARVTSTISRRLLSHPSSPGRFAQRIMLSASLQGITWRQWMRHTIVLELPSIMDGLRQKLIHVLPLASSCLGRRPARDCLPAQYRCVLPSLKSAAFEA